MTHLSDAELQAWIDEELDPGDRVHVADHLAACSDCRDLLNELRATAELFSEALEMHDEDMRRLSDYKRPVRRPAGIWTLPRWVGRAAAVTLLLGGAAVAAVIPGSPLRERILGTDAVAPISAPDTSATSVADVSPGASIMVRPLEGRLRIRVMQYPVGTRIRIALTDGADAVASLPDGEPNARFVVAAGLLDVMGPGLNSALQEDIGVDLQMPRRIQSGVVELNGVVAARVSNGRIVAERQVSRLGDRGVIIEIGE